MPDASQTGTTFGSALQTILTRGLDAASSYYQARLNVNDPTPAVTGPNGQRVASGQLATFSTPGVGGVPTWVWIVGAAVLGIAIAVPLLRR